MSLFSDTKLFVAIIQYLIGLVGPRSLNLNLFLLKEISEEKCSEKKLVKSANRLG